MSRAPTSYDVFSYRGFAYMDSHPARLASLAAFYGMDPTPVSRCRVLELGCGVGANVIPMADQYPDSEFIGIDLSGRSIEFGSGAIAALGLKNITLRHASITDVTADYGAFDYIIAHGVYSWVPADVREKMLAIFHGNLRPQGVAFVSYNAYPGSHLRNLARDMMLFHVRDIADPRERVAQARAVVKALAEASAKTSVHGAVLRAELARIEGMGDDILFHDDLDEVAVPFLLHQVVADAERHGLQYLCDSSLWRRSLDRVAENMRGLLSQFNASAYMARDQYHDFIDGHGFRRTLLCHGDISLDRDLQPGCIKRFYFASSAAPSETDIDPATTGNVEFKTKIGDTLASKHPLSKAALLHLSQCWPMAVSFEDLLEAARARLMARAEMENFYSAEQVETMTRALFNAMCSGDIEFYLFPLPCVAEVSELPEVSRLVRRQAQHGSMVTSLRHDSVMLEDEAIRQFVQLVDGTRNTDQLVVDFRASVEQMPGQSGSVITREKVLANLKELAKLALLIR
jgi:methyltransferase-like protein/2-polyprenyl-3-methyl-5-hydroxy-6-metoxy-1,4-benzoquinol methylase